MPKVLEYLEKIRPQTIQQYWRKEFVEKIADIQGKSVEELNELAANETNPGKLFAIDNLIISMNPPDMFKARFHRAADLELYLLYDEAIEEYQRALACVTDEDKDSDTYLTCLFNLQRLLEFTGKYFLGWEMAQRCLAESKTIEDKFIAIESMLIMASREENTELVEKALGYYADLKTDYAKDTVQDYKNWLKEQKQNKK